VAKEKTVIRIGGMHCAACAQTIERALKKEPGIIDAYVNFAAKKATVEYDSSKVSLDRIAEVIKEAGYEPVGISKEDERTREVSLWNELRLMCSYDRKGAEKTGQREISECELCN